LAGIKFQQLRLDVIRAVNRWDLLG